MLVTSLRAALPVVLFLLAALGAVPAQAARGAGSSQAQFFHDTNRARAHHDRRSYDERAHLQAVAQRWAEWMAAHHTLRHNPYLGSQVGSWRSLGENVGCGAGEDGIQHAFMGSTEHRDNILSRRFRQVGIGTARGSDGKLYVDEVFRQPS